MNENNKEIEVKVLNIDKIETIKKLVSLNAPQIKKEFQVNYMFDYPDGRFFSKGGYVRIRRVKNLLSQEEKNIVTFKELISRDKFKISKEIEFASSEFEATKNFLEALGLQLFRVDEKFRESFSLDDGLVEIDTWAGVPTYLEVEAKSENEVKDILSTLDYTLEQSTSMTLAEIMKHYNIANENRTFTEEDKKLLDF